MINNPPFTRENLISCKILYEVNGTHKNSYKYLEDRSSYDYYVRSLNTNKTCFIINHKPNTELTNMNLIFDHPKRFNDIELYMPFLFGMGLLLILDIAIYFERKPDHHSD